MRTVKQIFEQESANGQEIPFKYEILNPSMKWITVLLILVTIALTVYSGIMSIPGAENLLGDSGGNMIIAGMVLSISLLIAKLIYTFRGKNFLRLVLGIFFLIEGGNVLMDVFFTPYGVCEDTTISEANLKLQEYKTNILDLKNLDNKYKKLSADLSAEAAEIAAFEEQRSKQGTVYKLADKVKDLSYQSEIDFSYTIGDLENLPEYRAKIKELDRLRLTLHKQVSKSITDHEEYKLSPFLTLFEGDTFNFGKADREAKNRTLHAQLVKAQLEKLISFTVADLDPIEKLEIEVDGMSRIGPLFTGLFIFIFLGIIFYLSSPHDELRTEFLREFGETAAPVI